MKNPLVIVAALLGILLLITAVIYFITPANNLPSFLPGFDPNSTKTHFKHGIGTAFLGLASFAYAWFKSKPKSLSTSQPKP